MILKTYALVLLLEIRVKAEHQAGRVHHQRAPERLLERHPAIPLDYRRLLPEKRPAQA
jgi:hypothetical protein